MDEQLNLQGVDRAEFIGGQPGGVGTTLARRSCKARGSEFVTSK